MRKLNEVLPVLQDRFEQELNRGNLLELEAAPETFVDELLEDALAEARTR